MIESIIIDGIKYNLHHTDYCNGPYKIFENVAKEFSDMKYLVCFEYCSRQTLVAAFDNEDDAEVMCSIRNLQVKART